MIVEMLSYPVIHDKRTSKRIFLNAFYSQFVKNKIHS